MAIQAGLGERQERQPGEQGGRQSLPDDQALRPVMEGARARGVADAFELVGQGAILIDPTGAVLHAGLAALRLMADDLSVQSGHLVAQTATANQAIQDLMVALLDQGAREESIVISRSDGLPSLQIRGFAFAPGVQNPYQLLAAVLLVDECSL
jgi:hypothetical protein